MADDPVPSSPSDRKRAAWRWRDHIEIHPAAELFPLMDPDELQKVAADIKQNGIKIPTVFFKDEHGLRLLDGRNRLDAAELAGDFAGGGPLQQYLGWSNKSEWNGRRRGWSPDLHTHEPPDDPYEIVVSLNILRRHLDRKQKQALVDKLLKENPDRSDRQTAALAHVSPTTVGTRRQGLEAKGEIPEVTETVGADGRIRTATPRKTKLTPPEHTPEPVSTPKPPTEGVDWSFVRGTPPGQWSEEEDELYEEMTGEIEGLVEEIWDKYGAEASIYSINEFAIRLDAGSLERAIGLLEEQLGRRQKENEEREALTYDEPEGPIPAGSKPVYDAHGQPVPGKTVKIETGPKMSKADFDKLIRAEEKRLGKAAVDQVKRAHGNARYRRDWAPILAELASLP